MILHHKPSGRYIILGKRLCDEWYTSNDNFTSDLNEFYDLCEADSLKNEDGDDFEQIKGVKDRGEMVMFNPNKVAPILYLVKSDGKEVIPISRGIHSEDEIIIQIKRIDKHLRRLF